MTAFVLSAVALVPVAFTGLAAWAAAAGNAPGMLAGGLLASLLWLAWALLAALVLPRPEERAGWTAEEAAALRGSMDMQGLLDATPRKGKR